MIRARSVERMVRCRRVWLRSAALTLATGLIAAGALAAGDVRLPGLHGGQLTSAELAKGDTVVVVWASWSPRCRDIVDRVNAIQSKWGARARVVAVDFQEDSSKIEEFLRGKNLAVPVYLDSDGAFSKSMAVTSLPGLVVFHGGNPTYQGKLPADVDATLTAAFH